MNILEDKGVNFISRYFRSTTEILFNPSQFYRQDCENPVSSSIKFYLFVHYLLFLITLPVLTTMLEKFQLYLRLYGYFQAADIFLFNEYHFTLINIFIFPIITILFWALTSFYLSLLSPKYSGLLKQLFSLFLTVHTATAVPVFALLMAIIGLDNLVGGNALWPGYLFLATPLAYMLVMYYLSRHALIAKYHNCEKLTMVMLLGILTLGVVSSGLTFFL